FEQYNADKLYSDQVKPFNFLLASQAKTGLRRIKRDVSKQMSGPKPIAPYDRNHQRALLRCFDRNTGERVAPHQLKTYRDLLSQYHLHPEAKFQNGDYADSGFTERRHVVAVGIEHIGK